MSQTMGEKLARLFLKQQQYNAALSFNPYISKTAKTPAAVFSDPEYQSHLLSKFYGKEKDGK